jgi:hypothetical protein
MSTGDKMVIERLTDDRYNLGVRFKDVEGTPPHFL